MKEDGYSSARSYKQSLVDNLIQCALNWDLRISFVANVYRLGMQEESMYSKDRFRNHRQEQTRK